MAYTIINGSWAKFFGCIWYLRLIRIPGKNIVDPLKLSIRRPGVENWKSKACQFLNLNVGKVSLFSLESWSMASSVSSDSSSMASLFRTGQVYILFPSTKNSQLSYYQLGHIILWWKIVTYIQCPKISKTQNNTLDSKRAKYVLNINIYAVKPILDFNQVLVLVCHLHFPSFPTYGCCVTALSD